MATMTTPPSTCATSNNLDSKLDDAALLRYSRHILLPEIGVEGQARISAGRVLVVGAGGLGSPAALYLAAAGVGTLVIADHDHVDLTNLQRQILHPQSAVGMNKAASAKATLETYNSEISIQTHAIRLSGSALEEQVSQVDLVLDCSDSFETRHEVNRACVRYAKPLVSGAVIQFEGQISVFDTRQASSPCYHCLFPEAQNLNELRCAVMGVFAPLVGIVGCMQAAEALKILGGFGSPCIGRLLLLDGLNMQWRSVNLSRDYACPVCEGRVG